MLIVPRASGSMLTISVISHNFKELHRQANKYQNLNFLTFHSILMHLKKNAHLKINELLFVYGKKG